MSMSAKEDVLEFVRRLPDDATATDILAELVARFGPADENGDGAVDAAWVEEVNRRVEEVRSGRARMIPGDEVMRRLREKYG